MAEEEIRQYLRVEFLLKTDSGYLKDTGVSLRVEFLLKTDSGYLKDTGVNKPWQPLSCLLKRFT
jgi:hypothetical protein